ncbi:hypothetical protein ADUPG1_004559, partial [Aduncisulcus paluster]
MEGFPLISCFAIKGNSSEASCDGVPLVGGKTPLSTTKPDNSGWF